MQSHVRQTVSAVLRCFTSPACRTSPGTNFSVPIALVLCRLDYCNSVLFGIPANRIQRLQSVQNVAARLIFRIRRSEHITQALISLHWLRVLERRPISFKLAIITYRSIYGTSPSYLYNHVSPVLADMISRRWLRFSTSHRLDDRLSTVGKRAFPVSGATVWSAMPLHVASTPSFAVFRRRLKTVLFSRSYQDTII